MAEHTFSLKFVQVAKKEMGGFSFSRRPLYKEQAQCW